MELIIGIQKAVDYIDGHLLDELSIGEIAKQAHVSPFHFQRVFHILTDLLYRNISAIADCRLPLLSCRQMTI